MKYFWQKSNFAIDYWLTNWHGGFIVRLLDWYDWMLCDLYDDFWAPVYYWGFWMEQRSELAHKAFTSIEHLRSIK